MPWRTRREHKYFYLSHHDGTRSRNVYVGGGAAACLAAVAIETRRQERQQQGKRKRVRRKPPRLPLDALTCAVRRISSLVKTEVQSQLLAAGFHQPNRGPWRKRRVQ